MSVTLRRTLKKGGSAAPAEPDADCADSTLGNFKSLLQLALKEAEDYDTIYMDILAVALAILDACLNNRVRSPSSDSLATQVAATALDVLSSIRNLIPDFEEMTNRDRAYNLALRPHLESLGRSLDKAHRDLVKSAAASPKRSIWPISPLSFASRAKEIQTSYDAFALKVSFFMSDPDLSNRRDAIKNGNDGHVLLRDEIQIQRPYNRKLGFEPRNEGGSVSWAQKEAFWDDTYEANVRGESVIVKAYTPGSYEHFRRDLKIMRAQRHSNMPALFGYSRGETSTPFIALSMKSFIPILDFLPMICAASPETALNEVWKMLISMRSTAEHLVKKGLINDLDVLRVSIETAVVDESGKVILTPAYDTKGHEGRYGVDAAMVSRYFTFIYQSRRDQPGYLRSNVDCLPRALRPLRYALMENPAEVLHSSYARLSNPRNAKSLLARWRPGRADSSTRTLAWPAVYDSELAIGDLGQLILGSDGSPHFVRHTNVQQDLGGYVFETKGIRQMIKRLSRTSWGLVATWRSSSISHLFLLHVPTDLALDYLSKNAQRLAEEFKASPEDLVLVTRASISISASRRPKDHRVFIQVDFDDHGRLSRYGWTRDTGYEVDRQVSSDSSSDWSAFPIRLSPSASYIQVEEDELLDPTSDQRGSSAVPSTSIGNIGYFEPDLTGPRRFNTLENASVDLIDFVLKPWQGNNCQRVEDGIWRSDLIEGNKPGVLTYSWIVTAHLGLPYDLQPFFLHSMALEAGHRDWRGERELLLVDEVTHQVRVSISSSFSKPARLYVHFGNNCEPMYAYLSESLEPAKAPDRSLKLEGSEVSILAGVSHGLYDHQDKGRMRHSEYKRAKCDNHSRNSPGHPFLGHKLGDVGHWADTPASQPNHQWIQDGRVTSPISMRKLKHSRTQGCDPCEQISDYVWKAVAQKDTTRYRWVEEFLPPSMSELAELHANVVKTGVPSGEILIVTRVAIDVFAAFSPDDTTELPDLYAFFPPEGGCFAYFSGDRHYEAVDCPAFTKLDLENWQLPGGDIRMSFQVERKSLGELYHNPQLLVPSFGLHVGDVGYDMTGVDGLEGDADTMWLGNILPSAGRLQVVHDVYTNLPPMSEMAPGIWMAEPCGARDEMDAAMQTDYDLGPVWWWESFIDEDFLLDHLPQMGRDLVDKHGIEPGMLRICTSMRIDVSAVVPLEVSGPETSARIFAHINPEVPSRSRFYWGLGDETDEWNGLRSQPQGFQVKARDTVVIEPFWADRYEGD